MSSTLIFGFFFSAIPIFIRGIIAFVVGDGSNGDFFDDATSLTATITTAVANDHLVSTQQPKAGVVDEPVATQVKVVDSHGRIDTSVPDGVNLPLNAGFVNRSKCEMGLSYPPKSGTLWNITEH